jgi:RHH-type transcriptional regulator, rel operon repressor / antitoxin RelB
LDATPFEKGRYDHRIPTAMARVSRYGTINPIDMSKTESAKFTVSVKVATKHRLEKLAKIAGRSSSFLAAEAISEYLDVNESRSPASRTASPRSIGAKPVSHEKVREWVLSWDNQQEQPIPRPLMI